MRNFLNTTLIAFVTIGTLTGPMANASFAQVTTAEQTQNQSGDFAKKKYKVNGSWSVIQKDGQTFIKLSDDFKTKNGPDLKIFLSRQSSTTVSGQTATEGAVNLGALKSNKGGSEYLVPAGINLSDFNSVLVHCEAFSVLWGAGDLS